jgi:hypothetical protein
LDKASGILYDSDVSVRFAYQIVPSQKTFGFLIPSISLVRGGENCVEVEDPPGVEDPGTIAEGDTPGAPGAGGSTRIEDDSPDLPGTEADVDAPAGATGAGASGVVVATSSCGHEVPGRSVPEKDPNGQ